MSLRHRLALASLALLLSACQSFAPSQPELSVQRNAWEAHTPGCDGPRCPLVNIDTLTFASEPALTALVEQRLLGMTMNTPDAVLPDSLQAYQDDFLQRAEPGWMAYLQAKIREQHDNLVVIELSSYLHTGGAHGMPGRGFINYDRALGKALSLTDMLRPGQEALFWQRAEQAHQRWLKASGLDQDAAFLDTWPFTTTANIALGRQALYLKYDVYSIAPYAMGHPELVIPYDQLADVLKPQYLPEQD